MVEPRIVPREEHPISRRDIDPDALKVLYRLQAVRLHRVSGRRQRARPAPRPPPEGLRHRHLGASLSGQEAVPELLDHRPALPARAREVRTEGDRGRHVPPAGRGRRGSRAGRRARAGSDHAGRRASHPSRQHVRHAGRGRVPPRLHDQRAVLRHRQLLDHRLRRRPRRSARRPRPLDRRSRRPAEGRSGADDPRDRARGAPRLHDRADAARRDPRASPGDREELAAAAARGVLQDPARRLVGEGVPRPRRGGPAGADLRGAAQRARPSRSGSRSRRSTPTAAGSTRRPRRCRTRSCSAACWCRSASR